MHDKFSELLPLDTASQEVKDMADGMQREVSRRAVIGSGWSGGCLHRLAHHRLPASSSVVFSSTAAACSATGTGRATFQTLVSASRTQSVSRSPTR